MADNPREVALGAHDRMDVFVYRWGLVTELADQSMVEPNSLHLPLQFTRLDGTNCLRPTQLPAGTVRTPIENRTRAHC